MTAAALSAVRASEPRRSTRRPMTSRTLWGRPSSARSPTRRQRPPSCLHDRPGLRQVTQQLAGEERVAGRLARDLRGERTPVLIELVPGRSFHQREHILGVKAGELDSLHALLAVKVGQQRRQRMIAREIGVTVGPHHHHRHRGARRDDVAQQRQRRRIGPVQVIEDQQQRLLLARSFQQARDSGVEQVALCLRVALARGGQLGHAIAQGGHQARQVAAETLHMGIQDPLRRLFDQVIRAPAPTAGRARRGPHRSARRAPSRPPHAPAAPGAWTAASYPHPPPR